MNAESWISEYPKIVQFREYFAELDAEAARLLFLFASVFENVNILCEECESPAVANDDAEAPALLLCSFCNLSFHNSTECLGKAGGEIIATVRRRKKKRSSRVGVPAELA